MARADAAIGRVLTGQVRSVRNALWSRLPAYGRRELTVRNALRSRHAWDVRLVRMLSRSPGVALDVGANIGAYTLLLAPRFSGVHAVEPNAAAAARLAALSLPNVTLHRVGLSSAPGEATLFVPEHNGVPITGLGSLQSAPTSEGLAGSATTIRLETLDGLALDGPLAFVKIDVEGHELDVIDGGMAALARDLPPVLIELEERHRAGAVASVSARLAELGYAGWFGWNGHLLPAEQFEPDRHQPIEDIAKPDYANMFLFVAAGSDEVLERARTAVSPQR